jgi:hypothetical protein
MWWRWRILQRRYGKEFIEEACLDTAKPLIDLAAVSKVFIF